METKTFRELSIKITYSVDLSEVEIPEKVTEQVKQVYGRREIACLSSPLKYPNLEQQLIDYTKEEDGEDPECKIETLKAE